MNDNLGQLKESLVKKWDGLLNQSAFGEIKDNYRRQVTAVLLQNQQQAMRGNQQTLRESTEHSNTTGNVENWDPILMSLVRRAAPQMIAYDNCGVQPMTGPTGLVFAKRAAYGKTPYSGALGTTPSFPEEALGLSEARTGFSGTGGTTALSSGTSDFGGSATSGARRTNILIGRGFATSVGEGLGAESNTAFQEMTFSIDKISVEAKTRALKAEYTSEIAQDMKAIHGLDAETELANDLSTEILAEINREVIRTIYVLAQDGAQKGTQVAGTYNLDTDANGRWSVERFKGLLFQIEREANTIAKKTRRGKGNFIIASSDVVAALHMAGVLDYNPALQSNLTVDDTGSTFAGTLAGSGMRVYVDPYHSPEATNEFLVTGYKGNSPSDAGLFYCPYVPLQMMRAIGEDTFQPKIGFKTRYGLVQNPFVLNSSGVPLGQDVASAAAAGRNQYYSFTRITNLM